MHAESDSESNPARMINCQPVPRRKPDNRFNFTTDVGARRRQAATSLKRRGESPNDKAPLTQIPQPPQPYRQLLQPLRPHVGIKHGIPRDHRGGAADEAWLGRVWSRHDTGPTGQGALQTRSGKRTIILPPIGSPGPPRTERSTFRGFPADGWPRLRKAADRPAWPIAEYRPFR